MSDLEQLIQKTDSKALDWLEAHIELLDDNMTQFVAKIGSEVNSYQIPNICRIVTDPEFCGLTLDDAYNVITKDEKQGTWDALDLYNKEYAANRSYGSTTRYQLYNCVLFGPKEIYAKIVRDPDLAFMCFTVPSYGTFDKVAAINNNQIQRSSFRVTDLKNTNFWVGIIKDPTVDTYPAKWKFDTYKHPMKVYHSFRTVTKVGGVYLAGKQNQSTSNAGSTEIIFVPAKRIATGGAQSATLNTYIPEEIVDKYNLPKAVF